MAERGTILVRAYAKVNLCLAVAPAEPAGTPRAGWHRIASWFHAIDLWDDVEIEPCDGPSRYERAWAAGAPRPTPIDWPEDKDLAVRAHRLMESLVGRPLPVVLRVTKRIPTGGGLGGGSSDAAAVMAGLNAALALGLDGTALRRASARLGSDVAYFIPKGRAPAEGLLAPPAPAIVGGFGDQIGPAARAEGPVTLVLPKFGCATPDVYRAFDRLSAGVFREGEVTRLAGEPGRVVAGASVDGLLFNDLRGAAESVEPALRDLRGAIEASGRIIHMSGSGSTLFLLGEDGVEAPAGCVVVRTRLVAAG